MDKVSAMVERDIKPKKREQKGKTAMGIKYISQILQVLAHTWRNLLFRLNY